MDALEIEDRDRVAAFSYSGDCTVSALAEVARLANDHCSERKLRGAFIDLTPSTGTLEALERFELGRTLASFWNRTICLAILLRADQTHPLNFGAMVSQNRGVRIRVFTDPVKAERWLKAIVADHA